MSVSTYLRKINIFGRSDDAENRRVRRYKALRAAADAIDLVKDKIAELKQERDAHWMEACGYAKSGQKPAARHALTAVRENDVRLLQLDRKRWLLENFVLKIESIETDRAFATALSAFAKVITVDPEQTAQVLGEAVEKCDVLKDIEKAWNREYVRAENGAVALGDVQSVEDMMRDLESVVARETLHKSAEKKKDEPSPDKKPSEKTTAANIAEILRNIAKAMDGSGK